MHADEPNLRIYERAFSGRNAGTGRVPAAPAPIRLTQRDFAPAPRTKPVRRTPPKRAETWRTNLQGRWDRIPGVRATCAGLVALPLRAGLWWLKRWKLTVPATALAMILLAQFGGREPSPVDELEGQMMLLHAATLVVEARKEHPGVAPADLVDDLGLRPEELGGRYYAADRTILTLPGGRMRILGLPIKHDGPVLMIEIGPGGQIQPPARLTPAS